ncbi:MAG: glycerol-3-phosphate 1-O-acyltransferase PlsY [Planctomycetota bacterium]
MESWAYLVLPAAYLYGAVPYGLLAAMLLKGVDIRETGSGNIGATNAARTLGWKSFPVIFLLDVSKGAIPVGLVLFLSGTSWGGAPPLLAVLAGVAAILGHVFPVYLGFKGGKGVATSTGVFAVLSPWALLAAVVVWGAVFGLWRYVSLASMCAAGTLAAAAWLVTPAPLGDGIYVAVFATVGAVAIIALHHGNIRRLLRGEEDRIGAD